jgi:hypothetical protein
MPRPGRLVGPAGASVWRRCAVHREGAPHELFGIIWIGMRASRMGSMVSFSAVMLSTKWVNASALRARCPSSSANSATSLIHPTRPVWAKTGRWRSRWTKSRSRNGASTSSMNSGSTVSRSPATALKSNFANRSEMAARAGAAPIDDHASRRCYKVIGRIRWPRGDLTSHPTQRH